MPIISDYSEFLPSLNKGHIWNPAIDIPNFFIEGSRNIGTADWNNANFRQFNRWKSGEALNPVEIEQALDYTKSVGGFYQNELVTNPAGSAAHKRAATRDAYVMREEFDLQNAKIEAQKSGTVSRSPGAPKYNRRVANVKEPSKPISSSVRPEPAKTEYTPSTFTEKELRIEEAKKYNIGIEKERAARADALKWLQSESAKTAQPYYVAEGKTWKNQATYEAYKAKYKTEPIPKVNKPVGTPKLPQENALVKLEKTNQQAANALGGKVRGGSGMVGKVGKVARGVVKTKQGKAMLGIAALGMLASLVGGREDETPITYQSDSYNMR